MLEKKVKSHLKPDQAVFNRSHPITVHHFVYMQ